MDPGLKDRKEFRIIGIAIVILGTVIDTLAIILGIQINLGFLLLLIPGTCYILNASVVLILDRPKYWLQGQGNQKMEIETPSEKE